VFSAGGWWLTPVILATQKVEIRGSQFEASQGKQFTRPYLEKQPAKKGWWSSSKYIS
jgi:hypothetical protein